MYVQTYVTVTLRNVAVTSRKNVANQRSYVVIIARKEGGARERIIINAPQALDRSEGQGTAEVDGAGPSAMVVEKDVVGPSAMVVESDSVWPSPMVTEVGSYAQSSRAEWTAESASLIRHEASRVASLPGRFVALTSISIHLLIVHLT